MQVPGSTLSTSIPVTVGRGRGTPAIQLTSVQQVRSTPTVGTQSYGYASNSQGRGAGAVPSPSMSNPSASPMMQSPSMSGYQSSPHGTAGYSYSTGVPYAAGKLAVAPTYAPTGTGTKPMSSPATPFNRSLSAPTKPNQSPAQTYPAPMPYHPAERSIHWVAWSLYCFDEEWVLLGKYQLQITGTQPNLVFFALENLRSITDKVLDLIMQSSEADFNENRGLTKTNDESYEEFKKRVFLFAYFQKSAFAMAHSKWNESHPLQQYC